MHFGTLAPFCGAAHGRRESGQTLRRIIFSETELVFSLTNRRDEFFVEYNYFVTGMSRIVGGLTQLGRYPFPHIVCILLTLILLSDYYSTIQPPNTPSNLSTTTTTTLTPLPYDPNNHLAYHRHLELTTSPPSQINHSPTLTFNAIYVLSLPTRLDRREQMQKLARALGLKIVFVDAFSKKEPFVKWIAERVAEVRGRKKALMVSLS